MQAGEPLGLNAQHHHRLRLAQRGFEVALDRDARAGVRGQLRQQSVGPQSSTRAPSRGSSSMFERATRLCRMSPTIVTVTPASVSAVTFSTPGPQMRQDGAQVEQRLRGMLVHAVAGVEHRQARRFFQQPRRARGVVAQDDGLRAERAQRQAGVFQRLALFNAGGEA